MNELKEKLMSLGLDENKADEVIQAVAEFVKSKLPGEYQGAVDSLLAGEIPDLGSLGGLLGGIKGFFGK